MKLNKIPTKNGIQHIGISERKGSSIVINEYKNVQGETRFNMPICDLVFCKLDDAVNHLKKLGY